MRKLGRVEWIFVSVSLFLSCLAAFLFFFQAERLGMWFGLLVDSEQKPLGKVEYTISSTLRKSLSSQRFFAIDNQQKVFDRDTIMTKESSEAVMSLSDGGSIDVGPDSLVELVFRETNPLDSNSGELILNVKKGTVTGVSGMGKIKVMKDGKVSELQAPPQNSLLAQVEQKQKADLNVHCGAHLSDPDIFPPKALAGGGMEVSLDLDCGELFSGVNRLTIEDPSHHSIIENEALQFEAGVVKPHLLKVTQPGAYTVKWEKDSEENKSLIIPDSWSGILFETDRPDCEGILHFKFADGISSDRDPAFSAEIIGSTRVIKPAQGFSLKVDDIPYPARIRVKSLPDSNGFSWSSPLLALREKRQCNQLTFPKNREQIRQKHGSPVLFTWKQNSEQSQVRFELAEDEHFQTSLKKEVTAHNFMRILLSTKGLYYWRVIDVKTGESSDVFVFRLQ